MRYLLTILLLPVFFPAQAQMKLSGQIKGSGQSDTLQINIPFDAWYYKQNNKEIITGKEGFFSIVLPVEKPQSIFILYKGARVIVYAEPKKNLSITFNRNDLLNTIKFGGDLKAENEFRKETGLTFSALSPEKRNDSLVNPLEIINAARQNEMTALKKLAALKTGNAAFKHITQKDIAYFLPASLWNISWDIGVFSTRNAGKYDVQAWREALQTAYRQHPLSNDDAVDSYFYQQIIAHYPIFLEVTAAGREAFRNLAEKILQKPFVEVLQEVKTKGERFWKYKILNYGLTGRALEFATASFINNSIYGGELGYLQEVYDEFLLRYPNSRYLSHIKKITTPYFLSLSSPRSTKILFEPANIEYNTLEEILQKFKGRVVYIDLWGTWCGPCREQFAYTKELKDHFEGKPVDYVYIAYENSNEPEKLWKETVNFYNLPGTHILAGKQLKSALEKLYAPGAGLLLPTYILADKEGKINTLRAKSPSAKDALYKQIEQVLNQ